MRWLAWLILIPLPVQADDALIAVASNFLVVLEALRDDFESSTPHAIEISNGSTGVLYAQIVNGAPYDVLLAADQHRPMLLEQRGIGVAGTRFTYGNGRLALWTRSPGIVGAEVAEIIASDRLRNLAIANPALAPYGRAAIDVLDALDLADVARSKLVYGENVSQAFSMAVLGSADAAFVALSQVLLTRGEFAGAYIEVPDRLYGAIRQDAILLTHGANNAAAVAFMAFLQSDAVQAKIAAYGY